MLNIHEDDFRMGREKIRTSLKILKNVMSNDLSFQERQFFNKIINSIMNCKCDVPSD